MKLRSVKECNSDAYYENLVSCRVDVACPKCSEPLSVPGKSYFTSWNEPLCVDAVCAACGAKATLYDGGFNFIGY